MAGRTAWVSAVHAGEVDGEHALPRGLVDPLDVSHLAREACVVDEDVDAAETVRVARARAQASGGRATSARWATARPPAPTIWPPSPSSGTAPGHDDDRALLGEEARGSTPDAAAPPVPMATCPSSMFMAPSGSSSRGGDPVSRDPRGARGEGEPASSRYGREGPRSSSGHPPAHRPMARPRWPSEWPHR